MEGSNLLDVFLWRSFQLLETDSASLEIQD